MKISQSLRQSMGPMFDLYLTPSQALSLVRWIERAEDFMAMIPDSVQDIQKAKDTLLKTGGINEISFNNSVFHTDRER